MKSPVHVAPNPSFCRTFCRGHDRHDDLRVRLFVTDQAAAVIHSADQTTTEATLRHLRTRAA